MPSYRRILLAILATLAGCAASASPSPTWTTSATILAASESRPAWTLHRYGSDGFDSVSAVATLPDGGLVIAGHFEGELELGSDRLKSAGETDAFIARLDRRGDVEWAARLGGAGFDAATALVVDRAGHLVLVGNLSGPVAAGNHQLRARGESDIFLAAFGNDGSVRWATALGRPGWDTAAAAALTTTGDIAVVGASGTTDREGNHARADDADVLVALVGSAGKVRWTRSFGGDEWDQGLALAADRDGDIAVGGSFGGSVRLGDASLVSAGLGDGFVARLTSTGRVRRAERFGGKGNDAVTALAIGPDRAYAIAGHFSDTMAVGKERLASAGDADVFVARHDRQGEPVWAFRTGAAGTDEARGLIALPDGSLLVAVTYALALELVAGDGPSEVVLHHVSEAGALRDLVRLSGSFVSAHGLAMTRDGRAVLSGSFAHRVRLGSRRYESKDALDGFLMTTSLQTWGN